MKSFAFGLISLETFVSLQGTTNIGHEERRGHSDIREYSQCLQITTGDSVQRRTTYSCDSLQTLVKKKKWKNNVLNIKLSGGRMQSNVVLLFFSNNFESNISIVLVIQKKQNPLKKEKSFSLPEFLLVHIKKANKIWRKWKCSVRYYNDRYVSLCNCPNP